VNKKEKITTKNIGRTKRKTHSTPKPQKPRNENAIKHKRWVLGLLLLICGICSIIKYILTREMLK
jgi:hypothetical protein